MPVLMAAAYDENGKVNVMNAARGMICAMDKIALFIDEVINTGNMYAIAGCCRRLLRSNSCKPTATKSKGFTLPLVLCWGRSTICG